MAGFRFTVVEDPAALRSHIPAWEELAAAALEPNPFYESWMLLPALEAFGGGVPLSFVFAYAERPGRTPALCGFFPLERLGRFKGLPFRHVRLWNYPHRFLGTPLLRPGHAAACLEAFLEWLAECGEASMMEWGRVGGDGAFRAALQCALRASGRRSFVGRAFARAMLRPREDGEAYLRRSLPGASRKEFRRLERRLAEGGGLRYEALRPGAPASAWTEEFLALEARGWKGRRGSALGCSERNRRFFVAVTAEAARRRRLMMLALAAGGRTLAMKCNFLAHDGAFAFKIAYAGVRALLARHPAGAREHTRAAPPARAALDGFMRRSGPFHGEPPVAGPPRNRHRADGDRARRGRAGRVVAAAAAARGRGLARRHPSADVRLLDIEQQAVAERFGKRPFLVGHGLVGHALFSLERLVALSKALPADRVEYNAGDLPISVDPAKTPRNGLSPEETIRRIRDCRSWLVLKNVEQDPAYRVLLERCLAQLRVPLRERQAYIFVSSPGAVTPYHMDPEENFLLQIRGRKVMHVFDPADRAVLSERDIERFFTGAHRNLAFRDEYRPKAERFALTPGVALHVPLAAPHWVQNGPEVSISFSITCQTRESMRRTQVYRMNARLRRMGLNPRPAGQSPLHDGLKQLCYRMVRRLAA